MRITGLLHRVNQPIEAEFDSYGEPYASRARRWFRVEKVALGLAALDIVGTEVAKSVFASAHYQEALHHQIDTAQTVGLTPLAIAAVVAV